MPPLTPSRVVGEPNAVRRRSAAPTACPSAGLRRVAWVTVDIEDDRVVATAAGVSFRLPRTVEIPVREAARLAAAGVPVVVHRAGTETRAAS